MRTAISYLVIDTAIPCVYSTSIPSRSCLLGVDVYICCHVGILLILIQYRWRFWMERWIWFVWDDVGDWKRGFSE